MVLTALGDIFAAGTKKLPAAPDRTMSIGPCLSATPAMIACIAGASRTSPA